MTEYNKRVFANNLNRFMDANGKNQTDIKNLLNVSKSTVSSWCNGQKIPRMDKIEVLANYFDIMKSDLIEEKNVRGRENKLTPPTITEDIVTFPVIGEIAAGYEHMAYEDWSSETVEIPTTYLRGRPREDFFVLSVRGNSMHPLYMDSDKVLILKQPTLNHSGEIGAILYDSDYATLKRVNYVPGEDWMELIPANPEYSPMRIEGVDLEQCRVLGIPKLVIREIAT